VHEPRVRYDGDDSGLARPLVDLIEHPRMVVMSADCDLLKDYQNRTSGKAPNVAHAIGHVMLCDLYSSDELAPVLPAAFGGKEMKRVNQNEHERYHHFPSTTVAGLYTPMPELYLDFKKCVGFPAEYLYHRIQTGGCTRVACVSPVFLQDLMHRLYGFLSRVGPDFEGNVDSSSADIRPGPAAPSPPAASKGLLRYVPNMLRGLGRK
jgi:hypothetical protein